MNKISEAMNKWFGKEVTVIVPDESPKPVKVDPKKKVDPRVLEIQEAQNTNVKTGNQWLEERAAEKAAERSLAKKKAEEQRIKTAQEKLFAEQDANRLANADTLNQISETNKINWEIGKTRRSDDNPVLKFLKNKRSSQLAGDEIHPKDPE